MTFGALMTRVILAGLLALLMPLMAEASPPPGEPSDAMDIAQLAPGGSWTPRYDIAVDVDPDLTPDAVISGAERLGFAPAPSTPPQFRANRGDIWLRFSLTNSSATSQSAKLYLLFPYLEQFDLFETQQDGHRLHSTAGAAAAPTGQAVSAAFPAFSVQVAPGETNDYFVRVRSSTIILLPAILASESAFAHTITTTTLLWSLIAGAALAFAIYAASMSFMAAHTSFRIYVAFALAAAFYIILSSGLLSTLMGSRIDFNFGRMVYFSQAVAMAFGTIFIMIFLDMQATAPRLYRVFYAFASLGLLTGFGFLLPMELSRVLFFAATGAGPLVLALGLGWMAYRGVQGSRNVLIAWLPCLLATVWIYLRVPEITPYLPINHFLLPIAMAFTLAYLSALLGGRVRESEFWAHTDALTGLGNRRLLDRITDLENRQPGERYATAVAIDLDAFKPLNDTHGHCAGDAVLMAVAERLRTHYSGRGDIFRLGGDEFLVLGYQWVTRMDMLTQTNSFLLSLKQSLVYEDTRIPVGASAGIAFHDHRHGFSDMLTQADAELYYVKQAGGGSMRIADQRKRERRRSPPVVLAANNSIDDSSVAAPFAAVR